MAGTEKGNSERPRYPDDWNLAQRLASGDSKTWPVFQEGLKSRLHAFVEGKYPNVLTDVHREEIYQGVLNRLEANNYRVLREFRADCKLSSYLTRQIEWEILDWLQDNSDRLFEENIDKNGHDQPESVGKVNCPGFSPQEGQEEGIPPAIMGLRNEWRWAFLLRYYDYFGFPPKEIRLLAKKRGIPVMAVTDLIIRYMENDETGAVVHKREWRDKLLDRLNGICHSLRRLDVRERLVMQSSVDAGPGRMDRELSELKHQRQRLEQRREQIQEDLRKPVTIPYQVIAEILGEDSEGTVRSYIFFAKKHLKERLREKIPRNRGNTRHGR